jgi:hypothetical protein
MKTLKIALLLLLAGGTITLHAQQTKVHFGLGGLHNSFQDTRFSDVQFGQTTGVPELGFSRVSEKDYWHANAYFFFLDYDFPNYDTVSYTKLAYNVRLGYLRNLKPSLFVGFNWDVLDYYRQNTEFLGNSADAYKLSSDLYVSGKYIWDPMEHWQFNFGLDLGLFTLVNTEPSFTANFQQNTIDNGEVTFIDEDTRRPYNLRNMELRPFWDQLNIRTLIELNFKRRLGINYSWDLRSFSDNQDYPVTDARHLLTLRFHFINHTKK